MPLTSEKSAVVGTCVMILALAGAAKATEPDYAATGPYLGIGVAYAWDQFDGIGRFEPDVAIGFDAWGGYRFLSFLSAELQVEYLNGFDVRIPGFFLPGATIEAQAVTFTGNLKAHLPLGRFQPFIMSGVGLGHFEFEGGLRKNSDTDLAARFGGGIDFYVTEAIALQTSSSYVLQTGDLDGLDYVSLIVGVQYRF